MRLRPGWYVATLAAVGLFVVGAATGQIVLLALALIVAMLAAVFIDR